MKTFNEFISESSLSRLVGKMESKGTASISAERGNKSKEENKERSKRLERHLRGVGLNPTKTTGKYNETDHGEQDERSYFVSSGKMGKRRFRKEVVKAGEKFDQDSVLLKPKPGLDSKAKWVGTTKRKTADPKYGKSVNQGTLKTWAANKPLPPNEGGTQIKNKTYQFK